MYKQSHNHYVITLCGQIGDTLVDESQLKLAKQFLDEAANHKVEVFLPSDYVVQATNNERQQVVFDQSQGIPEGFVVRLTETVYCTSVSD